MPISPSLLGKTVQLGDWLMTPNPIARAETTLILPRHQGGDAWDYLVITHTGTKATVKLPARTSHDYEHEYEQEHE
jgi:hypothetical protein